MGHYRSNLRDIEFNLFEVLGREQLLGTGPYADLDLETARTVLAEVEKLATGPLADSLLDSDRNPPFFDPATHTATLPDSFKRSYAAWVDAEWWRLGLPEELGGTPCPRSLHWAIAELVLGANPALWMYASWSAFANVIWHLGTEEQRAMARTIIDRHWGTTMVLTEPDAGSDVGAGRSKAVRQDDGSWHITGVKRFITSGEHDLSDNIVHMVLARPEGAGPGTKGLSLFLVPKVLFDWETGELGERNGVVATNVEHKMGLKSSTTCELTFGDGRPAVGWLLGEVHDGIAQMFTIIEFARMMVGAKAISTLSTGYLNALAFAKDRVQGADLLDPGKTAPRVTITHHPDVRRSLLTQKAYVEGLRALVLYTASIQDGIQSAHARGEVDAEAEAVNDLLLPIVKGYGSERSWVLLGSESLQTFGGSGFVQDYPLEQYVRDAKIDTLYEGTTAIQAQDFFFRKIVKDQGRALTWLVGQIGGFASSDAGNGRLKQERELLGRGLEDVQGILGTMLGALARSQPGMQAEGEQHEPRALYQVALNTSRLLFAAGDLVVAWLLLRQAEVALDRLDGDGLAADDRAFYEGKVAAAQWFARQVLPKLRSERTIAEAVDLDVMDLDEAAF
jgi:alkylation response protein AidB-like acyl-CoA dehydrogenase